MVVEAEVRLRHRGRQAEQLQQFGGTCNSVEVLVVAVVVAVQQRGGGGGSLLVAAAWRRCVGGGSFVALAAWQCVSSGGVKMVAVVEAWQRGSVAGAVAAIWRQWRQRGGGDSNRQLHVSGMAPQDQLLGGHQR